MLTIDHAALSVVMGKSPDLTQHSTRPAQLQSIGQTLSPAFPGYWSSRQVAGTRQYATVD